MKSLPTVSAARRAAFTIGCCVVALAALTACSSPAPQYHWDRALDNLPHYAPGSAGSDLGSTVAKNSVVTIVRASDGFSFAIALHDGRCWTSTVGPHDANIGVGAIAPKNATDATSQTWKGENAAIGHISGSSATLHAGNVLIDCGTKGAWFGISRKHGRLTLTGAGSMPAAAQLRTMNGVVITPQR